MTKIRGRVFTPRSVLPDGVVEVTDDRIVAVRPADPDEPGPPTDDLVLPGLVDLHCHGGGGASFTTGDPRAAHTAAAHHAAHGTTTLLGSTVTDSRERMLDAVAALAEEVDAGSLAGIHVEGPFLASARCGAQDPAHLRAPDPGLARELLQAGRGHVRVMTIAPELPGAAGVAALLQEHGVIAAAGHTEADASTLTAFLRAHPPGLVTHLWNGMPPVHHRSPGPVLGALGAAARGEAILELIADGVHLADDTVAAVHAMVGDRVVWVTDAVAAAGMPDGDYVLGPQRILVNDGVARLATGGSIAGGTTRLVDVVRRQIAAGLEPVEVVANASIRPAAVLGRDDVGAVRPGCRADLLVAGSDWQVRRVMRSGRWIG